MSVSEPRICPHCGSDTYFAQNFGRVRDKAAALELEMYRRTKQHAADILRLELAALDKANEHAWLQRKAHKQRLVINRLEAKLRKLGQVPHEPEQS